MRYVPYKLHYTYIQRILLFKKKQQTQSQRYTYYRSIYSIFQAANFWPSLSGIIGFSTRTTWVWMMLILLHTPLRFIGAIYLSRSYIALYEKSSCKQPLANASTTRFRWYLSFQQIIKLACVLNMLEIVSLCVMAVFMHVFFGKAFTFLKKSIFIYLSCLFFDV